MNWDIKEIHNYNEYMQKYSIHSLLAKIFAQRKYNEQDVQGHTSKRLIYHDFSLFLDADLVLDRIQEALENDEKIRQGIFTENLTAEIFTDYIFTLFLSILLEKQNEKESFLEFVKNYLY